MSHQGNEKTRALSLSLSFLVKEFRQYTPRKAVKFLSSFVIINQARKSLCSIEMQTSPLRFIASCLPRYGSFK